MMEQDHGKPKILVIEDEQGVRDALEDGLKLEGYDVVACNDGTSGLAAFDAESPDLILLDLVMPGMDGLEVCKKIRSAQFDTPIIMLTAKSTELDKVVGLEIGADDYLTKPFSMRELFARVKAHLRRLKASRSRDSESSNDGSMTQLTFGEVWIDFRTYRAKKGEIEIELSAKEFELLRCLASQPDVPITRSQLLDQVWGYNSYPTTRTVDNFIARLRHKVESAPEKPRHIITVYGVGYKFVE